MLSPSRRPSFESTSHSGEDVASTRVSSDVRVRSRIGHAARDSTPVSGGTRVYSTLSNEVEDADGRDKGQVGKSPDQKENSAL